MTKEYKCCVTKGIVTLQDFLEDVSKNNFTLVTVTQDREFYTVVYYIERVNI